MALMQITVVPLGTGGPGVGDYIADIELFLRERKIEHSLHDMGTIVASSVDELLQLAGKMHRLPFTKGVERVITNITLDDRPSLERKIGEKKMSIIRHIQNQEKKD